MGPAERLVWITRSEPGATELAQILQRQGIAVLQRPVIEIERLRPWQSDTEPVDTPDVVVVTSVHASRGYVSSDLFARARHCPHLAVGDTTARDLGAVGCKVVVAEPQNSQGLIAWLSQRPLRRVWIAAGTGGRNLVQMHLRDRGVEVCKIEFYRRRLTCLDDVDAATIGVVELASVSAVDAVHTHCGSTLRKMIAVAASERIAQHVEEAGCQLVHTAAGASPRAVAATITALVAEA